MVTIENVNDHISYFKVPYKDIFVGIYVLQTEKGALLFDAAATDWDVDNYIRPALEQLGVRPTHVFISHNHADHGGGLARVRQVYPDATVVARSKQIENAHCPEDGELLLGVLQVVTIPGHTADSAAILDTRTGTLVCGDCLQSYGIYGSGFWYGAIGVPEAHLAAIEKLCKMPLQTVATAHDYHPCGMISRGEAAISRRLDHCVGALKRIVDIAGENPTLDDEQLAQLCNDGTLPKVSARIAGILRKITL